MGSRTFLFVLSVAYIFFDFVCAPMYLFLLCLYASPLFSFFSRGFPTAYMFYISHTRLHAREHETTAAYVHTIHMVGAHTVYHTYNCGARLQIHTADEKKRMKRGFSFWFCFPFSLSPLPPPFFTPFPLLCAVHLPPIHRHAHIYENSYRMEGTCTASWKDGEREAERCCAPVCARPLSPLRFFLGFTGSACLRRG